jgi:hypothetical protein
LVSNPSSAFKHCISHGRPGDYEIVHELKIARAQVGSLTDMKRNMCCPAIDLKGFQPLHFSWQP